MNTVNKQVKATLEHVKNNPDCSSEGLSDIVVHDLCEKGFLSGCNVSCDDTYNKGLNHEYIGLNITFDGERHIESINAEGKDNPKSRWRIEKLWLPILLMLFAFVLGKYFG